MAIVNRRGAITAIDQRKFSMPGACGFRLAPSRVKHRFGIAVVRLSSFEDEIQRRLEWDAFIELGRHTSVVRVTLILPIHYHGHLFEGFSCLLLGDDTVMQPVGHVLT